jgi:hypothetical protein
MASANEDDNKDSPFSDNDSNKDMRDQDNDFKLNKLILEDNLAVKTRRSTRHSGKAKKRSSR